MVSRELRPAMDASLHAGLRVSALVIGTLEAFFVLADLFVTPPAWAVQVALVDLALATLLFATYFLVRSGHIAPRHAHPVAAALALTVTLDTLHDTFVLADPVQTVYVMLVLVGAGSLFLSTFWLYVVIGGSFAGWIVVAAAIPQVDWTTYGFGLFAAAVLSALVHAVRVATFARMEGMRIAESKQKEQLQIREQALEAAVGALRESEERYRRLVEGAPDALLVRIDGAIAYANPAAARLFGAADAKDLVGRPASELLGEREADAFHESMDPAGRAPKPVEMECIRCDGSLVSVEAIGLAITYLGRAADQTILRDITDRKRADAEERVARERLDEISRLKEMDRVKTQFVNTISHELRTPLTPIKVQLHILKAATSVEAMHKATGVLDRNVTRLAGLVDELLEVARIQAGTLTLTLAPMDVGEATRLAVRSYEDVAHERGIELLSQIETGLHVLGDDKRLQQVMYNLLGNALKFTDKGGRIEVQARREGGHARVSVADTGAGLDAHEIERLFAAFSQIHDPMERVNSGTGLGLFICRGIVEGHGGTIGAASEGRGKGTTFTFTLPLAS